jgi:hypothetical protein
MANAFALDRLRQAMLSQKILENHGSSTRRSSNAAPSVSSGVELPTRFRQTRPYARHAARPLTEMQITVADRYRRLLITSSAQIFASLVFDLSHFYAIVADFRMRIQYLFSKPRYSVLMGLHLSRSGAVRGIRQRIKRHAKQSIEKRASERVKQPFVRMKSDPFAKSMKRLERVKGIEPSYSAWKSGNLIVFSKAVLTFSVILAH